MRFSIWTVILTATFYTGCNRCGTIEIHTDYVLDQGGDLIEMDLDDAFEWCGDGFGAFGSYDLTGDGEAVINFAPDHADNDTDWAMTQVFLHLWMDSADLDGPGEVPLTRGEAYLSVGGITYAGAVLDTDASTLEILEEGDHDPPCTPFREKRYRFQWDVLWGSENTEWYASDGKDWIGLSYEDEDDLACD